MKIFFKGIHPALLKLAEWNRQITAFTTLTIDDRLDAEDAGELGGVLDMLRGEITHWHRLNMDSAETACLKAIILFNPGMHFLEVSKLILGPFLLWLLIFTFVFYPLQKPRGSMNPDCLLTGVSLWLAVPSSAKLHFEIVLLLTISLELKKRETLILFFLP